MGTSISARLKRLERTSETSVHRSTGCPVCDRVPEDRWPLVFRIEGLDGQPDVPVCMRCQRPQGNVFNVVQIDGKEQDHGFPHLASTCGG